MGISMDSSLLNFISQRAIVTRGMVYVTSIVDIFIQISIENQVLFAVKLRQVEEMY